MSANGIWLLEPESMNMILLFVYIAWGVLPLRVQVPKYKAYSPNHDYDSDPNREAIYTPWLGTLDP